MNQRRKNSPARTTPIRGLAVLSSTVVLVLLGSCAPPEQPQPPGVEWVRDIGGSLSSLNQYVPAFESRVTRNGSTTVSGEPTSPYPAVFSPVLDYTPRLPQGSTDFPWNGLAGIGVTTTVSSPDDRRSITFPGGSCFVGLDHSETSFPAIVPSPDRTKVVVVDVDSSNSPSVSQMRILQMTPEGCPPITSHYGVSGEGFGTTVVWAPDSSAVVYSVRAPSNSRIDRLNAVPAATPTTVVGPTTDWIVPTGWSIDDRLLATRITLTGDPRVTSIETRAMTGGPWRVLDSATWTAPADFPWSTWHYGYFVPNTTNVVYNDASTSVTNSDGHAYPRLLARIIADADGAVGQPIDGTEPPLTWHQENIGPLFGAVELTDVPNAEIIARFVR